MCKLGAMKPCCEQEVKNKYYERPSLSDFFPILYSTKSASSLSLVLAAPCLGKVSDHMNPQGGFHASQNIEVWIYEQ